MFCSRTQHRDAGEARTRGPNAYADVSSRARVKSGNFRQSAKFGQQPCLFYIVIIVMKIKLTKQTVKILRQLIKSRLIWISIGCKCITEFS